MTETSADIVATADRLADDVLFPAALATDADARLPVAGLDALAEAGLYGLTAQRRLGGLGAEQTTAWSVIEALAGGCLTTTFIWIQHLTTLWMAAHARPEFAERWAPPMCRGETRAGIAFAHLRRPGPPVLVAAPHVGGGWSITGTAPWVTGWGGIDVVGVGVVCGDRLLWCLCDAQPSPTLSVQPLELAALNASATVELRFLDHVVEPERVIAEESLAVWLSEQARVLRQSGSMALGVAGRCAALLGGAAGALPEAIAARRRQLDEAAEALTVDSLSAARAAATLLAVEASTALVVVGGGRSIAADAHAQRLAREAMFLLVQGQTAAIKADQLAALQQAWVANTSQ